MNKLSTYRLEHFVPFNSEVYQETLRLYNESLGSCILLWILVFAAVFIWGAVCSKKSLPLVALSSLLAVAWGQLALVFQWQYLEPLFWPSLYLGWVFLIQVILLGIATYVIYREKLKLFNWPGWIGLGLLALFPLGLLTSSSLQLAGWGASRTSLLTLILFSVLSLKKPSFLIMTVIPFIWLSLALIFWTV